MGGPVHDPGNVLGVGRQLVALGQLHEAVCLPLGQDLTDHVLEVLVALGHALHVVHRLGDDLVPILVGQGLGQPLHDLVAQGCALVACHPATAAESCGPGPTCAVLQCLAPAFRDGTVLHATGDLGVLEVTSGRLAELLPASEVPSVALADLPWDRPGGHACPGGRGLSSAPCPLTCLTACRQGTLTSCPPDPAGSCCRPTSPPGRGQGCPSSLTDQLRLVVVDVPAFSVVGLFLDEDELGALLVVDHVAMLEQTLVELVAFIVVDGH